VTFFNSDNERLAHEVISRYPRARSAAIPLLHLAQEQEGWVTPAAMVQIAELTGSTPAEVFGTASFYEMFKFHPVGKYVVNVCTNVSCQLLGGEELLQHAEASLGVRAGGTSEDGLFTLEDVECVAACTEAPCFTVNYRYFHRATTGSFDEVVADIRAGRSPIHRGAAGDDGELPEHGTLGRVRQHIPDDRRAGVEAPEDVAGAIDETVAVVMLTEVDYQSARKHDMAALTAAAHAAGALTVWDLAHSAGALPVDLTGAGADFAVGCTYKYLNGGPGAPAFIYVAPPLQNAVRPALSGWLGHEAPFAFDLDYRPDTGINRMRIGTPPVLAMAALEAALDIWDGVDMAELRAESIALSELFIGLVDRRCPTVTLASPRNPATRGAHVALRHPEGYAIMQALIARDVIGDFRAPDVMRFGFTPMYLNPDNIHHAVDVLAGILDNRLWDRPEYRKKAAVT